MLNGRFVGVEPRAGIDVELLGAVLNSTFVSITRLLEGTTTGVEGAYDVGPPAARRMLVPDVRQMSGPDISRIGEIIDTMRRTNRMPPGPTRLGHVDALRNELDLAILQALGSTRGEASATAGRVYEGYARWRASIEDVESLMRANRREMSRQGRTRAMKPAEAAARAVWAELDAEFPAIPHDFLSGSDRFQGIDVPASTHTPPQEPLFSPGLVITKDGQEFDLGSYQRVKYLRMLIEIGFEPPYQILGDDGRAGSIVEAFDSHLDRLRGVAAEKARALVGTANECHAVVEGVVRLWFRKCRTLRMAPAPP